MFTLSLKNAIPKRQPHAERKSAEQAAQRQAPVMPRIKPVVGIIGAKGGVGATTIAVNLTAAFARTNRQATLIDAHLQDPGATVVLGKEPKFSLLELTERSHEVSPEIIHACSVPLSESIPHGRLISPPLDGQAAVRLQLTELAHCVDRMRECSDVWLIDLPRHLDRHLVTLMDRCDQILLVLEPTLPSVVSAKRWLQVFTELGYPQSKVSIVINRAGGKHKIVEEQMAGIDLFDKAFRIPNAYELAERCANQGEPVICAQPKSPLGTAFSSITERLMQGFARQTAEQGSAATSEHGRSQ